jgi:hypothetical protein
MPHMVIYSEATSPTIYGFFPIFQKYYETEEN